MSNVVIRIFPSSHASFQTTELLEKAKDYLSNVDFLAENVRLIIHPTLQLIIGRSQGVIACPSCQSKVHLDMGSDEGYFFHSSYNRAGIEEELQDILNDDAPHIKFSAQQTNSLYKNLEENAVEAFKIDMPCCNSSVSFDKLELGNICALSRAELELRGEVDFFEFVDNPHLQNLESIVGSEFRAFIFAD